MKRLIALLIAILTLLFGGVQPADEPQKAPEAETKSVTKLSAEKERSDAVTEAEADQPEVITPSEPETTEDATEPPVEPADEPTPDTDTSFSQLTEEELLEQGIKPGTIRLSIGTEHIDDIIADLEGGFAG